MHNLGGIYYQMKSNAILFIVLGIVFLTLILF